MPTAQLVSTVPMASSQPRKAPIFSPGCPAELESMDVTVAETRRPSLISISLPVDESDTTCPNAPNLCVTGSQNVRVPTPAALSFA